MVNRVLPRRLVATDRLRSWVSPLVIGLGIWAASPTPVAMQDMTSMLSGVEAASMRWNTYIEKAAAGSVHHAELKFDKAASGLSGAGVNAAGVGTVAFKGKSAKASTPDETRVTRNEKKGRIVRVAPVAPPKSFSAGSILQRTSMIEQSVGRPGVLMAFAKPELGGKEIAIAAAFHAKSKVTTDLGLNAAVAALVNNTKPDILATAYAPTEPDYASRSPFAALLGEDITDDGRFIPPIVDGDHDWMSRPLPAAVFSAAEQKCLTTGIYFEARGESAEGQAAVAQVILNRVRNPAYPATICGVVYQNKTWRNRCQFSFACDGIPDIVWSRSAYKLAEEIAMAVTAGKIFIPEVASATHYHATYVNPRWNKTMERMKKIGLHVFYRPYGGGWS